MRFYIPSDVARSKTKIAHDKALGRFLTRLEFAICRIDKRYRKRRHGHLVAKEILGKIEKEIAAEHPNCEK